jgi:ABC-type glycerol-3-phosphate transport system substrate-binding protein
MKNLRKILPVALMAMTLCSCGGGVDVTNKHLPTNDPENPVEVVFWHCMGHDKSENLGKIVKKFNEQYAGKYRVEATAPEKTYDKLHETVMTRISTGEVPALCMGYPDSFSMYFVMYMEKESG